MGENLAKHHELSRDQTRGLPSCVRMEGSKRQGGDLISDRAVHIRQEVESHDIGAHGQHIFQDKRGHSADRKHNKPATQTHTPCRFPRSQSNRSWNE